MNWKAEAASRNPRIEYDEQQDRMYLTLACGYEFQTKGNGSTARLVGRDGERHPILLDNGGLQVLEACMFDQAANLNARDNNVAQANARVQLLAKALRNMVEHVEANFKDTNSCWVIEAKATLTEAGLLEKDK